MKRAKQQINHLITFIKKHPIATLSITTASLLLFLVRKYHYKLVVHPDIGGRYNKQNDNGFRHPLERGLNSQDIEISVDGNLKLRGWYVKHNNPSQILIYFHQNAGNIGGRLQFIDFFLQNSNSNILLVAYRGFSDSDGDHKPSESQIMRDACAILKKGVQLSEKQKLPLFIFGRSLGGAAAIHALSQPQFAYSAKGLILENTFTNIFDVGSNLIPVYLFPLKWLLWTITFGSYQSIDKMKNIHIPVLFIKGRQDEIVPTNLMDKLQTECFKRKRPHFSFQVPNGTHNDTWQIAGSQYFSVINEFINHCSKL